MAYIEVGNIIEYQAFRKNPGPLLDRAAEGQPLLVLKGRKRLIVMDAETYNGLMQKTDASARESASEAAPDKLPDSRHLYEPVPQSSLDCKGES